MVSLIGSWETGNGADHIAVSPMGPYVAVSGGQAIWICDIHSGTSLIGPLEGHRSPIRSLAFSPDGRTLASGSNDETIRLWDTKTGQTVVEPLTGHTHAVNCVRFSLDGRYVVSGSEDWTLCIWDAHTGGAVGEPIDAGFIPWALALIPGGKLAVGGVRSSDITVYDTGTLGALFECAGHEGPVKSISCSPDGRVFASGSNDCTVRIWDSASGRPIYGPLEGHEAWVASVDFSPDSKYIASGSWDGTLRIWDVSSGTMCGEPLVGPKRGVREVAFTLDGNCLISAGMDGHIRVWDVRSLGIAAEALKDQATAEMRVLGTELASANSFNQIVSQLDDQDGSTDMMNPLKTTTESVADITSASTPEEIVLRLGLRGCPNMTDQLDLTTCSGHPILSGGFGDIYQARLNDGAQVAIKTIRLYIGSTEQNQKLLKHAAHEIYAWSKCKHPNVQPLLGLVMFRGRIGMIAHWESKGDLSQYLKRYADTDRCVMSTQIAEGLAYLHASGVIHGDLKGANVLISQEGMAQLADFGNAKLQEYTLQFTGTSTRDALSSRWAAPELFEGKSCSRAADVYALGMTILEVITGEPPWTGKSERAIMFSISIRKEYPERPETHIPATSEHGDTLWALLRSCWHFEPEDRPSAADVLQSMKGVTQSGLKPR